MRFPLLNVLFLYLILICMLPLHANDKDVITRLEALEKKVSALETELRAEGKSYKDFLSEVFSEYYELIPDDLRDRIQTRLNFTMKPPKTKE